MYSESQLQVVSVVALAVLNATLQIENKLIRPSQRVILQSTIEKEGRGDELSSARETLENNLAPLAKADRVMTESNTPVVLKVLLNDKDPGGDKLKVLSVSESGEGATITINKNGTITFLPAPDFVGLDTFTYTIADGSGNSDKAKVSVNVTPNGKLMGQSENQVTDAQNQLSGERHRDNTGEQRNQGVTDNEATDTIPAPPAETTE